MFLRKHFLWKTFLCLILVCAVSLNCCAKLTKEHSKARNSTKASVIMTKRKNLKKPPDTYLGYVTYKNETEIVI